MPLGAPACRGEEYPEDRGAPWRRAYWSGVFCQPRIILPASAQNGEAAWPRLHWAEAGFMRRKLFFWELGGFLFTGALGTLLHFAYEWSGGSVLAACVSAVCLAAFGRFCFLL